MDKTKEMLINKINEFENIKKRCQDETYLQGLGMLSNYALRDFISWNLKDLNKILNSIK